MTKDRPRCENCRHFYCAGYHTYGCELDDTRQVGPFDNCNQYEER